MILKTRILFGLCSSAMLAVPLRTADAAQLVLACPAKYPDLVQMQIMQAKGWRAPFPGKPSAPLEQASVSMGPPEENGELIGTPLRGGAGERFYIGGYAEGLEKWAFCGYTMPSGYARLMYRLPVEGLRCETRLERERGRLVAARIWCE